MLSRPTYDHSSIFHWAEEHGATPAEKIANRWDRPEPTLDFLFRRDAHPPAYLRPISWEQFFAVFDLYELCFVYEQHTRSSTYFRLFRAAS